MSISKRSVDHWTAVIANGAIVASQADSPRQSPRQQAIAWLISSDWLIGEAADQGMRLSEGELARMVEEREESVPSGRAEFQAMLAASGETVSDIGLEVRARWAASTFRQRLAKTAGRLARAKVTDEEIVAFYRAHMARYHLKERRYFDLIERIHSKAVARALARRLGSGKRFAEMAVKELPPRPSSFTEPNGKGAVLRAVFSAKVGVVVGPMRLDHQYALFVLRRVEPARVQPLSVVRSSIEQHLYVQHRRSVIDQLVETYRKQWRANTDCQPGYVVQKCRQYLGSVVPEGEPFAGY